MQPNNDLQNTRNTARFFTEQRQLAWVFLVLTLVWGVYSYSAMPKRKDPEFQINVAVAICPWPGAGAEKIEQQVTRKLEEKLAQNARVEKVESISRNGVAVVYVTLLEGLKDIGKEFDDLNLKLNSIRDLPPGAGPIEFQKDFGDTAALMLTVASPRADRVLLTQRAQAVRAAIERARPKAGDRAALVIGLPTTIPPRRVQAAQDELARFLKESGVADNVRGFNGSGFIGADFDGFHDDEELLEQTGKFLRESLPIAGFQPEVWQPVIIRDWRDVKDIEAKLQQGAADKYSYRELDDYTDLIARTLQAIPLVSKVRRAGTLKERVFLDYSQDRLAAYGIQTNVLQQLLGARNITTSGGVLEIGDKNLGIKPSGEFKSEQEIGNTIITATAEGAPVYARDLFEITRGYEDPPRYLNYYTARDASSGQWQRTRAITLAVSMRKGEQIAAFGQAIDETLATLQLRLPGDLVLARTSDQPLQVKENVGLFTRSLWEAVVLVVMICLIGFREWRSAALVAASIPLTLAMTFGMMRLLGLDIQQVSVASLIIALGLLVDDPVVANDAIKRELATGTPSRIAAWLGPTKLAKAIFYATITNIVAYLPLLLVEGLLGEFIYSLPVVIACSLVASRIVSMTFVPLLAFYLLKPSTKPERSLAEQKQRGFTGLYYRVGLWSLEHRWLVLGLSFAFLLSGGVLFKQLRLDFFPKDLSYLSYLDVYLPEDAPLASTDRIAARAEAIIRQTAEQFGKDNPDKNKQPRDVLESLTTFVGGGGPRFWYSVAPEQPQLNYSQIIIQAKDKRDTARLVAPLQRALAANIPGARIDVRQLEIGRSIAQPVQVRISGEDIPTLRAYAEQVKDIFRAIPSADRVRDDWGAESFVADLQVDADKANLANVTNLDVAVSSAGGINGLQVTSLREGEQTIPVVARLRTDERARLSDLQNLYVYSMMSANRVPLRQISKLAYKLETAKLIRRNQFRTITVACLPVPGALPGEINKAAQEKLDEFARNLPPGYKLEIGGVQEQRVKGFKSLGTVMGISVLAIFLALTVQFKNAIKPLLVFSAIPFGLVGALGALVVMRTPFGFMAFLGIASLIGVIVSHVIVLFDFVEERREEGEPLREALLDAGIARLRPVFITVGATVFGLFPLALNGGPLWEGLCYAQIGGLILANYVTKLLVPALYAIFVLDLKLIRWEEPKGRKEVGEVIGVHAVQP
ncbi:MAG: efflux RND transporter permease subunit [Acidobacteria bacterium]|nr:efflux RND transporter permease subunit [Acidobacteriota bacterium]